MPFHATCKPPPGVFCGLTLLLALFATATVSLAGPITLVPTDLSPGDTYHLAFVTSTDRDATSPNIADYDAFVQAAADAAGIGVGSGFGDISWKVIGSTAALNAIDHIGVMGPVYRLDDTRIANGESDLFDGSIAVPLGIDELGSFRHSQVWTGSNPGGIESGLGLGRNVVVLGLSAFFDSAWIFSGPPASMHGFRAHLYAISEPLTVPLASPIPEPHSMVLFGVSLFALSVGVSVRQSRRGRRARV